ncbi:MAG: hypothetical protein ACP5LB_05325 [Candidatus Bathyarchaeia archaeon]
MGKNVTIYLPDDVAEKMEKFPEVNWSEVCRQAIVDYIETRSQVDLGPIIERLKKESDELYRKGQIFMYSEVIPKLSWEDIEFMRKSVDAQLLFQEAPITGEGPLGQEGAEQLAISNMEFRLSRWAKQNNVKLPKLPALSADSFYKGAIDVLMEVYNRVKKK